MTTSQYIAPTRDEVLAAQRDTVAKLADALAALRTVPLWGNRTMPASERIDREMNLRRDLGVARYTLRLARKGAR